MEIARIRDSPLIFLDYHVVQMLCDQVLLARERVRTITEENARKHHQHIYEERRHAAAVNKFWTDHRKILISTVSNIGFAYKYGAPWAIRPRPHFQRCWQHQLYLRNLGNPQKAEWYINSTQERIKIYEEELSIHKVVARLETLAHEKAIGY